jgi:hypothetical protein
MKDAEDEAFDELAKRQGHWGGGYQAKKAMAADKFCDANCVWTDHHPDCNMAADKLQEPAQEPVARVTGMSFGRFIVEPLNPAMVLPVGMALYSSPQENK